MRLAEARSPTSTCTRIKKCFPVRLHFFKINALLTTTIRPGLPALPTREAAYYNACSPQPTIRFSFKSVGDLALSLRGLINFKIT